MLGIARIVELQTDMKYVNIVVKQMNRDSVISKFIEKFGSLDPKPKYAYAEASIRRRFGISTDIAKMWTQWKEKFFTDNKEDLIPTVCEASELLPEIHSVYKGWTYDWTNSDLLSSFRVLQNSPFNKLKVLLGHLRATPLAIFRQDCDIAILVAPLMLEVQPEEPVMPSQKKSKYKGNPWINPDRAEWKLVNPSLLGSTYQLWECDIASLGYKPDSVRASLDGYPIAQLIKCSNCGEEKMKQDWINRAIRDNHPACVCSCSTYDDFCGCEKTRNMMRYDRIRRESTVRLHFMRPNWEVA
jgi:hypothetical protein